MGGSADTVAGSARKAAVAAHAMRIDRVKNALLRALSRWPPSMCSMVLARPNDVNRTFWKVRHRRLADLTTIEASELDRDVLSGR
jgi:hypothetical protein